MRHGAIGSAPGRHQKRYLGTRRGRGAEQNRQLAQLTQELGDRLIFSVFRVLGLSASLSLLGNSVPPQYITIAIVVIQERVPDSDQHRCRHYRLSFWRAPLLMSRSGSWSFRLPPRAGAQVEASQCPLEDSILPAGGVGFAMASLTEPDELGARAAPPQQRNPKEEQQQQQQQQQQQEEEESADSGELAIPQSPGAGYTNFEAGPDFAHPELRVTTPEGEEFELADTAQHPCSLPPHKSWDA